MGAQEAAIVGAIILAIAVGAWVGYLAIQVIFYPWFLILHLFSLGAIPMPKFEVNPFRRRKK